MSGASLMLFYVAWQNREGPGIVCREDPRFTDCTERWDPWPWFGAGLVLLLIGIVVFYLLGRRGR